MDRKKHFPKFELNYNDGSQVRGGGPDDMEFVTYTFLKSWVDAPGDGIVSALVENDETGRRLLHPHERYYCIPLEAHGGSDFAFTEAETGLGPLVRGQLGIVKEGLWVSDELYRELFLKAKDSDWLMPNSAKSSNPMRNYRAKD